MTYPAPDGYLMESSPTQTVVYECETTYPDGVFESLETQEANTPIGIQQIQVLRIVLNGMMTISIKESSDEELQEYIDSIQRQLNNNLN
jgi:hypothetical protein